METSDKGNNARRHEPDNQFAIWFSFFTTVQIAFLILKLMGMLAFPWWAIFLPTLVPLLGYGLFWIAIGWLYFTFSCPLDDGTDEPPLQEQDRSGII